jgi:hypothetical protein
MHRVEYHANHYIHSQNKYTGVYPLSNLDISEGLVQNVKVWRVPRNGSCQCFQLDRISLSVTRRALSDIDNAMYNSFFSLLPYPYHPSPLSNTITRDSIHELDLPALESEMPQHLALSCYLTVFWMNFRDLSELQSSRVCEQSELWCEGGK